MKRIIKRIFLNILILLTVGIISILIKEYLYVRSIKEIELVEVDHPYLGKRINSLTLDRSSHWNLILNLEFKKPELFLKFYSCYGIKIYFNNGEIKSYRTNGKAVEILNDSDSIIKYYTLIGIDNIVTKYWKIPKEKQCKD